LISTSVSTSAIPMEIPAIHGFARVRIVAAAAAGLELGLLIGLRAAVGLELGRSAPAAAGRRLEAQAAADLRQLADEHSAMDETESPRVEFGSA